MNSCGLAGIVESLQETAHLFHLLKAPRYFLTVLFALLWRTVLGSLLARSFNSGWVSSSSSFQVPCLKTSVIA